MTPSPAFIAALTLWIVALFFHLTSRASAARDMAWMAVGGTAYAFLEVAWDSWRRRKS